MPFCPKCGADVKDDDLFCPKCGSSLKEAETKSEKPKEPRSRLAGKGIAVVVILLVVGLLLVGMIIGGIFYFSSTSELPVGGVIQGAKEEVIKEAIKHINAPEINLNARVEKITSDGLLVTIQATVRNPNSVSIDIDDIEVKIKGVSGETYTQTRIYGASIPRDGRHTFTKTITIPFTALNEYEVITTIQSRVGAAGSGTKIPVSSEVRTQIPKIDSLIKLPEINIEVDFPRPGLSGVTTNVGIEIKNPNDFDIELDDVDIEFIRPNGEIIEHATIYGGLISRGSTSRFSKRITIGVCSVLTIISDEKLTTRVRTGVGLRGMEKLPMEKIKTTLNLPPFPFPPPPWC